MKTKFHLLVALIAIAAAFGGNYGWAQSLPLKWVHTGQETNGESSILADSKTHIVVTCIDESRGQFAFTVKGASANNGTRFNRARCWVDEIFGMIVTGSGRATGSMETLQVPSREIPWEYTKEQAEATDPRQRESEILAAAHTHHVRICVKGEGNLTFTVVGASNQQGQRHDTMGCWDDHVFGIVLTGSGTATGTLTVKD